MPNDECRRMKRHQNKHETKDVSDAVYGASEVPRIKLKDCSVQTNASVLLKSLRTRHTPLMWGGTPRQGAGTEGAFLSSLRAGLRSAPASVLEDRYIDPWQPCPQSAGSVADGCLRSRTSSRSTSKADTLLDKEIMKELMTGPLSGDSASSAETEPPRSKAPVGSGSRKTPSLRTLHRRKPPSSPEARVRFTSSSEPPNSASDVHARPATRRPRLLFGTPQHSGSIPPTACDGTGAKGAKGVERAVGAEGAEGAEEQGGKLTNAQGSPPNILSTTRKRGRAAKGENKKESENKTQPRSRRRVDPKEKSSDKIPDEPEVEIEVHPEPHVPSLFTRGSTRIYSPINYDDHISSAAHIDGLCHAHNRRRVTRPPPAWAVPQRPDIRPRWDSSSPAYGIRTNQRAVKRNAGALPPYANTQQMRVLNLIRAPRMMSVGVQVNTERVLTQSIGIQMPERLPSPKFKNNGDERRRVSVVRPQTAGPTTRKTRWFADPRPLSHDVESRNRVRQLPRADWKRQKNPANREHGEQQLQQSPLQLLVCTPPQASESAERCLRLEMRDGKSPLRCRTPAPPPAAPQPAGPGHRPPRHPQQGGESSQDYAGSSACTRDPKPYIPSARQRKGTEVLPPGFISGYTLAKGTRTMAGRSPARPLHPHERRAWVPDSHPPWTTEGQDSFSHLHRPPGLTSEQHLCASTYYAKYSTQGSSQRPGGSSEGATSEESSTNIPLTNPRPIRNERFRRQKRSANKYVPPVAVAKVSQRWTVPSSGSQNKGDTQEADKVSLPTPDSPRSMAIGYLETYKLCFEEDGVARSIPPKFRKEEYLKAWVSMKDEELKERRREEKLAQEQKQRDEMLRKQRGQLAYDEWLRRLLEREREEREEREQREQSQCQHTSQERTNSMNITAVQQSGGTPAPLRARAQFGAPESKSR